MPVAVLNERTKKVLKTFKRADIEKFYRQLDDIGLDKEQSPTCCGVTELTGFQVAGTWGGYANEKNLVKDAKDQLLKLIFTVEKGQLMMFHAPNTRHYQHVFKALRSLGFKQICPEWKNGVHGYRKEGVISLFCYKDV